MFNGAMDPEMFRLAQEQLGRMSPAELSRIQQQMMSNPELMRMASESMKNMRPEDLKYAAEQLKNVHPEEMAEIGQKMANASPEDIAAIRARANAQTSYELNAAEMLKKEGNALHSQGKYSSALQKYSLAKSNLKGIPSSQAESLKLACSLNLMSCYLKTRQYGECIKEGSEVLAYDAENVKALYRRGQAYKELGQLQDAVSDLIKAHEVSPDDETIAEVLRDAQERLDKEGGWHASRGLVIEEITEEAETVTLANHKDSSAEVSVGLPQESEASPEMQSSGANMGSMNNSECLPALKDDPDTIRKFQNFMANADPTTLAAMGAGNVGEVSPDMLKAASSMIGKMSPEELQKMLQLASSFPGGSPFTKDRDNLGPGDIPNVTPEMLQTATNMIGKMSPDDLQSMFQMASSMRGKESFPAAASSSAERSNSSSGFEFRGPQDNQASNRNHISGEASSSNQVSSNSRNVPPPSFPTTPADIQAQMRDQMKDPAMRQMVTSMMKNMSPEMMANMGEQFGFKLSQEDAARAQQAMSSLSPEVLDKMMLWADRAQRGFDTVRKTKNWLLGRPGMILAICMLILAVILHWLGYIGS